MACCTQNLLIHGLMAFAFIPRCPLSWQQMSAASEAELKFPPTAEQVSTAANSFGYLSCLFSFEAQV